MGTFTGYYGNMTIPEEKRNEFTLRMFRLLEQGGMMDSEQVQIYGKQISLLTPLAPNEDGRVLFEYNYFEDNIWETASYNIKTNELSTNKIGSRQFCVFVCAAYLLYEFYTKEFGIAERDGMIFHRYSYIGCRLPIRTTGLPGTKSDFLQPDRESNGTL